MVTEYHIERFLEDSVYVHRDSGDRGRVIRLAKDRMLRQMALERTVDDETLRWERDGPCSCVPGQREAHWHLELVGVLSE